MGLVRHGGFPSALFIKCENSTSQPGTKHESGTGQCRVSRFGHRQRPSSPMTSATTWPSTARRKQRIAAASAGREDLERQRWRHAVHGVHVEDEAAQVPGRRSCPSHVHDTPGRSQARGPGSRLRYDGAIKKNPGRRSLPIVLDRATGFGPLINDGDYRALSGGRPPTNNHPALPVPLRGLCVAVGRPQLDL